jgi:hypothetical protein
MSQYAVWLVGLCPSPALWDKKLEETAFVAAVVFYLYYVIHRSSENTVEPGYNDIG